MPHIATSTFLPFALLFSSVALYAQQDVQRTSTPIGHAPISAQAPATEKGADRVALGLYCQPSYTVGNTDGDYINTVNLSGVNNQNSGADGTSFIDLSLAGAGYMTRLIAGNSHQLSVVSGTYIPPPGAFEYVRVWIDYDRSYTYDADELVADFSTGSGPALLQTYVNIPTDLVEGYAGMRVRNVYNVADMDPCAQYSYGECEDYLVLLDDGVAPCVPLMDRGTTSAQWIGSVEMGDLVYNEPHVITVPYRAFLEQGTQLVRGAALGLVITNGYDPAYLGAWADWNQDGDWDDAGEDQGYLEVTSEGQSVLFIVNPPESAKLGYTV